MTNRESDNAKVKRFVEIYLFEHPGNAYKSYLQLLEEFKLDKSDNPSTIRSGASRFFRSKRVQKRLQEEREANQAIFDIHKEEIVETLKGIAFNEEEGTKDRLASLKQLSDIAGYATQKVDLNANAAIEVVIE